MRLNHPGIYRIIGKEFELLANIEGEAPLFTITSALVINDLVLKGQFKVITPDSIEIQRVNENPDNFIFIEYEYSEIAKLPESRKSIRGIKMPRITNEEFNDFLNRYLYDFKNNRSIAYTKAYIMERTNFSLPQINLIVMRLSKVIKEHAKLSNNPTKMEL